MLIFALVVSEYGCAQCAFSLSSRSLFFTLLGFSAVVMKSAHYSQEMPLHLLWLPRTMMSSVSVVAWQGCLDIFVVFGPWIKEEQKLHFNILEPHLCSSGKALLFHIQKLSQTINDS